MFKLVVAAASAAAATLYFPAEAAADGAQGAAGRGAAAYDQKFFAGFQPGTALEMVQQLPGFRLEEGGDARGVSGALGNVLIDGQEHTSKSETLKSALTRIPAAQVARIEVLEAADAQLAAPRQGLVANVITSRSASRSATATVGASAGAGGAGTDAELDLSNRSGRSWQGATFGAHAASSRPKAGTYVLSTPGSPRVEGELLDEATSKGVGLRGRLAVEASGNRRLEVDASARVDEGTSRSAIVSADQGVNEAFKSAYSSNAVGASATYKDRLGGGLSLSAILLQSVAWTDYDDNFTSSGYGAVTSSSSRSTETALRTVLSRQLLGRMTATAGIEAALNGLDGQSRFLEAGQDVALPSQGVRVSERRGEAFARIKGAVTRLLHFDAGLAFEGSELRHQGAQPHSAQFFFSRPDATLVFSPQKESRFTLSLSRRVEQLDFSDFLTSVAVRDQLVEIGNPNLVPEQRWNLEFTSFRAFSRQGAVALTFGRDWIDNPRDLIPFGGSEARGNLAAGTREYASTALTMPLEGLGISGAKLTTSAQLTRSEVTDPVTGGTRRLSGEVDARGDIRLRQDLPAKSLSWAVDMRSSSPSRAYHVREVKTFSTEPSYGAEVEYRPKPDWGVRLRGQLTGGATASRVVYPGLRTNDDPAAYAERRQYPSAMSLYLSARRSWR